MKKEYKREINWSLKYDLSKLRKPKANLESLFVQSFLEGESIITLFLSPMKIDYDQLYWIKELKVGIFVW